MTDDRGQMADDGKSRGQRTIKKRRMAHGVRLTVKRRIGGKMAKGQ